MKPDPAGRRPGAGSLRELAGKGFAQRAGAVAGAGLARTITARARRLPLRARNAERALCLSQIKLEEARDRYSICSNPRRSAI